MPEWLEASVYWGQIIGKWYLIALLPCGIFTLFFATRLFKAREELARQRNHAMDMRRDESAYRRWYASPRPMNSPFLTFFFWPIALLLQLRGPTRPPDRSEEIAREIEVWDRLDVGPGPVD